MSLKYSEGKMILIKHKWLDWIRDHKPPQMRTILNLYLVVMVVYVIAIILKYSYPNSFIVKGVINFIVATVVVVSVSFILFSVLNAWMYKEPIEIELKIFRR